MLKQINVKWITAVSFTVLVLQVKFAYSAKCQSVDEESTAGVNSDTLLDSLYSGSGNGKLEDENTGNGRNYYSTCNRNSPYRTIDGSCNNYRNPEWGTPGKPYDRFISNSYSDGIHELPRSKSNQPLPSARELSLVINPDVEIIDPIWSLLTVQWGQIIAHDLALTSGLSNIPHCCSYGQYTAREKTDHRCASIAIPKDDPFNGPEGKKCYNFYRTESTNNGNRKEPKTDVTSYMDLSVVYGSTNLQAKSLRSWRRGRLLSEIRNGQEWLPQSRNVRSTCFNVSSVREPCYRAGDSRVNQNTQLSVVQNILLREHNRIADYLCGSQYYQWDDEKCYQEARRILIAINQNINYYEFLPILIGSENMYQNKLISQDTDNYVNDYDPTVNPTVLNEHSTAAFRLFHSTIPGDIRFYTENRETMDSIKFSDYMNKPSIIEEDDNFVMLARGLSTQHQYAVDRFYDEEITQRLFRNGKKLGQDLRSRDIQRARDHGVGTYLNALRACNLSVPESFEDLQKLIKPELVELLKKIYNYLEDIELAVAGVLETLVPGTLVGPTFQCIITKQFLKTRVGDSYFFELGNMPGSFTPAQLESIRNSTIASIICNNVDGIEKVQAEAFKVISESNPLVDCSDIPQVDLSLWTENVVSAY